MSFSVGASSHFNRQKRVSKGFLEPESCSTAKLAKYDDEGTSFPKQQDTHEDGSDNLSLNDIKLKVAKHYFQKFDKILPHAA